MSTCRLPGEHGPMASPCCLADLLAPSGAPPLLWNYRGVVADMRRTKSELRRSVRRDQQERIEQAAAVAASCPVSDTVAALRPLLGPPKRRCHARQGLPLVLNADGEPARTHEEAEQIWIRHFSSLEAGQAISPQDLANKCLQRQLDRDLDALCISREDFPSRCELESSLRATKGARAAGVDKLPGEILKFAASTSSRHEDVGAVAF